MVDPEHAGSTNGDHDDRHRDAQGPPWMATNGRAAAAQHRIGALHRSRACLLGRSGGSRTVRRSGAHRPPWRPGAGGPARGHRRLRATWDPAGAETGLGGMHSGRTRIHRRAGEVGPPRSTIRTGGTTAVEPGLEQHGGGASVHHRTPLTRGLPRFGECRVGAHGGQSLVEQLHLDPLWLE